MPLQNDLPRGFVKHVVRRANIVARATTTATQAAASAAKSTHPIERTQTSSLEAPVVAILLGGFIGVFILFVLIGVTCKFANRPRADHRPQTRVKSMYQPSAAGYGSAAATYGGAYRGNDSMHDVSNPKAGLLDSAQPMGRGGRYEEADDSLGSSNGIGNGGGIEAAFRNGTSDGNGVALGCQFSGQAGEQQHRAHKHSETQTAAHWVSIGRAGRIREESCRKSFSRKSFSWKSFSCCHRTEDMPYSC